MTGKRYRSELSRSESADSNNETKLNGEFNEPRKKVLHAASDTEKPHSPAFTAQQGLSGEVIFTIEPFETEEGYGDTKIPDNFMDKCHFCKKVLPEETDIYLYRCFLAFCTPLCRVLYAMREKYSKNEND